jgi:hypothetical protein
MSDKPPKRPGPPRLILPMIAPPTAAPASPARTRRRRVTLHPRHRTHLVVASAVLLIATSTLCVLPPTRAVGPLGGLPWNAQARGVLLPTSTPLPAPVGEHPVASGPQAFLCAALPLARLAQDEMTQSRVGGDPLPHPWYVSVILAQWAIEQAWQMPTYTGYNFGNVSAIAGQPSVPGTSAPGSPGAFAYAPTASQGVADYVIFAKLGLYQGVDRAYPEGPLIQAIALGASPWDAAHYTPDGQPGDALVSVIQRFGLEHFDSPTATC